MSGAALAVLIVLGALLSAGGYVLGRRTGQGRPDRTSDVGTPVEHATFETLHTASPRPRRCAPDSPRRARARPPAGCAHCWGPTRSASPTGTACWPGTVSASTTASM